MSLDVITTRASAAEAASPEIDDEAEWHWAETAVTATAAALAVMFVSSLAVLMYLA
jgi:hypothetical protein